MKKVILGLIFFIALTSTCFAEEGPLEKLNNFCKNLKQDNELSCILNAGTYYLKDGAGDRAVILGTGVGFSADSIFAKPGIFILINGSLTDQDNQQNKFIGINAIINLKIHEDAGFGFGYRLYDFNNKTGVFKKINSSNTFFTLTYAFSK